MKKTLMTSVKLQKKLHFTLQQCVVAEGYGMHGKSKWIIESIESLLEFEDFPSLVEIADVMENLDEVVSIRLPESLMTRMENAVITVRKQYPLIEGVKSNLIRASIIQRLLRDSTSVTEVGLK